MRSWQDLKAKTWIDVLDYRAKTNSDEAAMRFLANGEDETEVLTFADLRTRAINFARSIQPLAEKGSRAVILLPNNVSFIVSFFGCIYAGFVPVPGYPPRANRNKDRITKMLRQCGGNLIISDANVDKNQIMSDLSNLGFRGIRFVDFNALDIPKGDWVNPGLAESDLAFLQYTSGSTSDPKGVCLTHANLLSNMEMIRKNFGLHPDTKVVSWLPLYHDMGLIGGILICVYMGNPFTFMPPAAFVQKPLRWLRALSKYKATMIGGPNFSYDLCVQRANAADLEGLDISTIEQMFNGAEPIRGSTLDGFADVYRSYGFNPSAFLPCYGLAEGSLLVAGGPSGTGVTSISVSKAALQKGMIESSGETVRLVSSGKVPEGLSVRIVNPETFEKAPANTVGEIWVRGPSISDGYWDNAPVNASSFNIKIKGEENQPGYFRTGDLGLFADDHLYVTGRIKDLLIIGGQNHYPQDLELTVQRKSSASSLSSAFKLDSDEHIGLLVEVGRTQMKSNLGAEALKIAEAIGADHELAIARIAFVKPGDLPRTSSGKVQRQLARARLLEGSLDLVYDWTQESVVPKEKPAARTTETSVSEVPEVVIPAPTLAAMPSLSNPESSVAHVIQFLRQTVATIRPALKHKIRDDISFASMGIDSISGVELAVAVDEKFGVKVPDTLAWDYPTILQAAEFIHELSKDASGVKG